MTPEPVFAVLDKAAVFQRLSIAPRTIEYMVRAGQFPPPVRIGKHVFGSEVALRKWQRSLFAAQEAWQP
jgi:prophage regulatory protein